MSTQAYVTFLDTEGAPVAIVRRTTDGYPDTKTGMLAGFDRFFDHLEETSIVPTPGQMYSRVEWLAAEYVHWCLGIGMRCKIEASYGTETAYDYRVLGGKQDEKKRPLIGWNG